MLFMIVYTTRRTCENTDCQAIYNVKSMPSKVEGICDKCGSKTIQRADETVEAISKRLDTYDEDSSISRLLRKERLIICSKSNV